MSNTLEATLEGLRERIAALREQQRVAISNAPVTLHRLSHTASRGYASDRYYVVMANGESVPNAIPKTQRPSAMRHLAHWHRTYEGNVYLFDKRTGEVTNLTGVLIGTLSDGVRGTHVADR